MRTDSTTRQTGSALLAVLWLSAALSVIALTVANSVRAETERTSTEVDGLRTYYLASGAITRALLWIEWGAGPRNTDGTPRFYENQPVLHFDFPSGTAEVEVIPETAKMNINMARPEDLTPLIAAAAAPPERISQIVAGIIDWRTPSPGGAFTAFDQFYLGLKPSFRARHASFEEIEELLLVQGMTPDLFYGSYVRDTQGRLVRRDGLRDCLSVYGSSTTFDINSVSPTLMRAIGISPDIAAAVVAIRRATPIRNMNQLAAFRDGNPAFNRLAPTNSTILTFRATARLRLSNGQFSDVRRSVSAMVKFLKPGQGDPPYHIMRWYDNAPVVQ